MFQQGVADLLTATGYMVDMPGDIAEWTPRAGCSLVLLTLCAERDWERLTRLRAGHPELTVVVFVEDDLVASGVRAIRAGASSVLPRTVHAGVLERAVHATMDGHAVMPSALSAALAEGSMPGARSSLPPDELQWLRLLAEGMTVARLANEAGYSERAMYRLLGSLYRKLGVHNRVQAILLAQRQGWLTAG